VKEKIFARKVNEKSLETIKERIESLEHDVQRIIDQERVEREMRLAEMEVKKAQNMMEYREQIYSRPNREWHLSKNMKDDIREESKKEALGEDYVEKKLKKSAFGSQAKGGRFEGKPSADSGQRNFKSFRGKSRGGKR